MKTERFPPLGSEAGFLVFGHEFPGSLELQLVFARRVSQALLVARVCVVSCPRVVSSCRL